MPTTDQPDPPTDADLKLIEEFDNVQVFEFAKPFHIERRRQPASISREELFPASYLFQAPNTSFKNALNKEVQARLEQTQFRENLATFGLSPLAGEQDRSAVLDDQNVLRAASTGCEVPFLPQLRPGGPQKSLVLMTGYKLSSEPAKKHSVEPISESLTTKTKKRGRPPVKTKRKLEQFAASPFLKLRQYNNRFLYAKAMLHPYLETYPFSDVGKILSALWNDYDRSCTSDYYTYLTLCTHIERSAMDQVRPFVNVSDTPDTKVTNRDSLHEIQSIVNKQQQVVAQLMSAQTSTKQTSTKQPESKPHNSDLTNSPDDTNSPFSETGAPDDTIIGGFEGLPDVPLLETDFEGLY